jgi:hypothetical protein
MASPFKGLDTTKPSRDYEYLRAGNYLCRVDEFRFGTNRNKVGYARFGFTVVNVIDPTPAASDPKGPHRVGEKVSWVLMADNDASAPNLKAALMAIAECPAEEITDAASELMASDAQPLAGLFVMVEARLQKMVKKEGVFTRISIKRRVSGAEVKSLTPPEVLKSLKLDGIKDED